MALKTALYYAIRRNLYNDIVAVTTEKDKGRWHGRYCKDNTPTHGAPVHGNADIMGRFATEEAALAMRARLALIADIYKAKRKELDKQVSALFAQERAHIEEAIASAN